MKADLPLTERHQMEANRDREIREALLRQHFTLAEEERVISDLRLKLSLRALVELRSTGRI